MHEAYSGLDASMKEEKLNHLPLTKKSHVEIAVLHFPSFLTICGANKNCKNVL